MNLHREHEFRFAYRRFNGRQLTYTVEFSVSEERWDGSFYYDFDVVRDDSIPIIHADAARMKGPRDRMEVKNLVRTLIEQCIESLADDVQ